MRKVFLDANVYFSGILNPDGGSRFILKLAEQTNLFHLVAPSYVVEEALRNLELKSSPNHTETLRQFLGSVSPEFASSSHELNKSHETINKKDAPVLQAALDEKCDVLVTLDRKHFLQSHVYEFARKHGLIIQTPKEFLEDLVKQL